jgi:ribosomal protein S12 methylthiotransferase
MAPKNQRYRIAVVSLGCAKNLVDTEVMCGTLASEGFTLVSDPEAADMMLINTCSFIADARTEAEEEIRRAIEWKRGARRGKRAVAVAGCLPQRAPADTAALYPDVDLFLGLDDVPCVATRIGQFIRRKLRDRNTPESALPTYLYDHTTPRLRLTPQNYAFVKIAEGCDHRCAYCIIPHIRGRQRSRTIDSVVAECRQLLDQGAFELNFIAQDSSRYGLDRNDGANLTQLLQACDSIDGEFWIRVLYTHPRYVSDELLDVLADSRHVVPYLDMPLQHIATPVLRAMRRGIDGPRTRALLHRIRERCPDIALRTTFLVGFPGETEDDFEELLELVREVEFDRVGVFAFSPEAGTPAAETTDGIVPVHLREERRDALLALQQEISLRKNRALTGTRLTVIADHLESDTQIAARTQWDAPEIDNIVHVPGLPEDIDRGFLTVEITDAGPYDLEARLVDAPN